MHAVSLLNAEDGGCRKCIMVTNNEVGEAKEKEFIASNKSNANCVIAQKSDKGKTIFEIVPIGFFDFYNRLMIPKYGGRLKSPI